MPLVIFEDLFLAKKKANKQKNSKIPTIAMLSLVVTMVCIYFSFDSNCAWLSLPSTKYAYYQSIRDATLTLSLSS